MKEEQFVCVSLEALTTNKKVDYGLRIESKLLLLRRAINGPALH